MRIGILGTTADPPHRMHVTIIHAAKRQLKLDRILFVPIGTPPHKAHTVASRPMRLAMVRIVAKKYGWRIFNSEIKRRGKSSTRDTIKALQKKYPRDKLFWIIGSDTLASLPTWQWKGGEDILDLCTFVVAPRAGYPIHRIPEKLLKKVIILRGIRPSRISSKFIRDYLRNGKKTPSVLDPEIVQFIKKKHLYTV